MQEISLSDLFKIVIKYIWLIIGVTVIVTGGVLVVLNSRGTTHYETTGQIVIKPQRATDGDLASQNAYISQTMATSKDLLTSNGLLERVSTRLEKHDIDLSPAKLFSQVTTDNQSNSLLTTVTAQGNSAHESRLIVNTVMDQFRIDSKQYLSAGNVLVVKGGDATVVAQSKRTMLKYGIAGVVLGIVISLIVVFILENHRHAVVDIDYLNKKHHIKTLQLL